MKQSLALAAVILFTAVPVTATAVEGYPPGDEPPAARSGNTSVRQEIKSEATGVKHGIKRTAKQIKYGIKNGVKNGAREVKQGFKQAFS